MEKVTSRVVRSEAEWKAIFEAQKISKRSMAGFCRDHDIDYKQFLYHRRKILTYEDQSLAVSKSSEVMSADREHGFIPIRVEGLSSMRLRFPRGLVLEADRIPSASWVVEVAKRWLDAETTSC